MPSFIPASHISIPWQGNQRSSSCFPAGLRGSGLGGPPHPKVFLFLKTALLQLIGHWAFPDHADVNLPVMRDAAMFEGKDLLRRPWLEGRLHAGITRGWPRRPSCEKLSFLKRVVLILVALLVIGLAVWELLPLARDWFPGVTRTMSGPKPDPASYLTLSSDLEKRRVAMEKRHRAARTDQDRAAIEDEARADLEKTLPAMMRCWLGTPWDFNGTAPGPGQGKIACGYFVATVLRDAGFRVDRYKLAQQASEHILQTFVDRRSFRLSAGKSYETFVSSLGEVEPGICVVGLDSHVGFLVNDPHGFRMLHSSGSAPWCVVDEGRDEAGVLQRSSYRLVGNLTAERGLVRKWLRAEPLKVFTPPVKPGQASPARAGR